jgi:hypothetical protein
MAWVGAEGAGIDRGIVQEHGDRVWASKTVKLTVIKICSIFICQVFDEMLARNLNSKF